MQVWTISSRKLEIGNDGLKSRGISWQWRAKRKLEGMLYGRMDTEGRFTGDDIIFIYPDMLTGIRGQFRNGELVSGSAVDIIGERCHQGLKEIEVRPAYFDPHVIWRKEVDQWIFIVCNINESFNMFRKIRKRCGLPMFWASIRLSWTRWRGKMYTSELLRNRLQMRDSLQGLTRSSVIITVIRFLKQEEL